MRRAPAAALGLLAAAGCLGPGPTAADTAALRAGSNGPPPNAAPASTEAAARVDTIGRKLIAANPQTGTATRSLMFHTIGAPQPEVFHRGTTDIYVTEGLVRLCASDGQLAAVLATELGRLVSEREALTPQAIRKPERLPPPDTSVVYDAGWGTAPDQTRLRELADLDRDRRAQRQVLPPPDPHALARVYLLRAGYHDDDLAAAGPLLQTAKGNGGFEKQMGAAPPAAAPGSINQ